MSDSTLNFFGGLLAFLAVIIPMAVKGWRLATGKGKQRDVLAFIFLVLATVAVVFGLILLFMEYLIGPVIAAAAAVTFALTAFVIDKSPIRRAEVVSIILVVTLIPTTLVICALRLHVALLRKIHMLEVTPPPATPSPSSSSPTPSSSSG